MEARRAPALSIETLPGIPMGLGVPFPSRLHLARLSGMQMHMDNAREVPGGNSQGLDSLHDNRQDHERLEQIERARGFLEAATLSED